MRYIADIAKRYTSAGFVSGVVVGELETLANAGIIKAGMLYNDARWKASQASDKDYDIECYQPNNWEWAEMKLTHEKDELFFGFGMMNGETQGIFAPPPLVKFQRTKNINVTVIDGGDEAEIVENFGVNSWEIEMNGILVDMNEHQYPADKVKKLAEFFRINDIIDVACPLFMDLGIKAIYLKEQSIEPVEGYPDTIKYSITAKSIKPAVFSLIL